MRDDGPWRVSVSARRRRWRRRSGTPSTPVACAVRLRGCHSRVWRGWQSCCCAGFMFVALGLLPALRDVGVGRPRTANPARPSTAAHGVSIPNAAWTDPPTQLAIGNRAARYLHCSPNTDFSWALISCVLGFCRPVLVLIEVVTRRRRYLLSAAGRYRPAVRPPTRRRTPTELARPSSVLCPTGSTWRPRRLMAERLHRR